MSREKQIEEMAHILCRYENGCDGCMFQKTKCFERFDAEQLYNAGYRKQEWISVEERFPREAERVLVYGKNRICFAVRHKDDWFMQTIYPGEITHWMPLPEPPKGE